MGMDIESDYGLGVFITSHKVYGENANLQEGCDDIMDYLEEKLDRKLCGYGVEHDNGASMSEYTYFITLMNYKANDILRDGFLKQKAEELYQHLTDLGLEFGEFDVVGGHRVY